MSKLVRHIFLLLFIITTGYATYGQVRHFTPAPRRDNTVPNTGQRVNPNNAQPIIPPAVIKGKKPGPIGKKLEAARNNYISRQLDLSDNESAKFWPVYQQYQQELTAVRILKRLNTSSATTNGTEQIDKEIYYESQIVAIRKRYRDAFLKILPPEKVSELYKSEREFNDELIKRLSESSERAGN